MISNKNKTKYVSEVLEDIKQMRIEELDIEDKTKFRNKLYKSSFQRNPQWTVKALFERFPYNPYKKNFSWT